MNHIIVRESSAQIRAIARDALRDNWRAVVLTMALYVFLTSTVPEILSVFLPGPLYYNETLDQSIQIPYAASMYTGLLEGAFTMGLCSFMLAFFRHRDVQTGYIFSGFEHFIKALGLLIVMGFFIFLWSLLLVIPGIVAAFRYSQAFYILADDPSKGIMECIAESKYLMAGNKGKLFCLLLSFIGWGILASLLSGLLTTIFPDVDGLILVALSYVFGIPLFFFRAYIYTAETAFYELVTGNLVAQPEIAEEDPFHR